VKDGRVCGVRTGMGLEIESKAVVLTNGTFLNGIIHIGEKQFGGGRAGESAARHHRTTRELGFEAGRMKTGTPPRLDGRSLDYSKMEEQPGDEPPGKFSYTDTPPDQTTAAGAPTPTKRYTTRCARVSTNRPCSTAAFRAWGRGIAPASKTKLTAFSDKDRHQLFVEPEGRDTMRNLYQRILFIAARKTCSTKRFGLIPGFGKRQNVPPGYAIEYDYFPPTQLQTVAGNQPGQKPLFSPDKSTAPRATKRPPARA
jgi:tRNA uridine 5-carboxymethylaminomethyl modification enzyme